MLAPSQARTGGPLQIDLSAGQVDEYTAQTTCQPEVGNA